MESVIAQRGLDDLVLLDQIDEDNVVNCLKQRFLTKGEMYTYSGNVLIAINPFKLLTRGGKPLYDESVIDSYRGACGQGGTPMASPQHKGRPDRVDLSVHVTSFRC
jgi:myosin heavy subunit